MDAPGDEYPPVRFGQSLFIDERHCCPSSLDWLRSHDLVTPRARHSFLRLTSKLRQEVILRGSFTQAREPTGMLVARINRARNGATRALTDGSWVDDGHDWICPTCSSENNMSKDTCRICCRLSLEVRQEVLIPISKTLWGFRAPRVGP